MAPLAKSRRFLFCCYRDNDRVVPRLFTGIELRARNSRFFFFFFFQFYVLVLCILFKIKLNLAFNGMIMQVSAITFISLI